MSETALKWISDNESKMIKISDKIWELAELGLVEFQSSKKLAEELEKNNFTINSGVAGMPTAFVATYGSGKPVIGIMGEYDALPCLSQKNVPYKDPVKVGAPGHGCGHNIYGASGVAAAIAVKVAMETEGISGTIKFFDCPAEEIDIGKVFMIRDGVFNGVDACLGHHPGQVNTARLKSSTATIQARFAFKGIASHTASNPENGRSALDAIELMNIGTNFVREHINEKARVHYIIEDGGEVPNVVPPYARSWYFVRAPEREQVASIFNRILNIAKGASLLTETTYAAKIVTAISNKISNRILAELVVGNMHKIGAPKYSKEELVFTREMVKTIPIDKQKSLIHNVSSRYGLKKLSKLTLIRDIIAPSGESEVSRGSTDVSDVSWNMPTIEFGTACVIPGISAHSWQMTAFCGMSIGHKGLIFAAKTLALCVLDLLTKLHILKKAKAEFKEKMKGRIYTSPLPPGLKPPIEEAKIQAKISSRERKQ